MRNKIMVNHKKGKDFDVDVAYLCSIGDTSENHEEPESGKPETMPRIETETSGIRQDIQ
jgi:hypothetical protein